MQIARHNRRRRGAMLVLVALLLPVVLMFMGFAVDLAYMQTTRMELRAVADAAARAGAIELAQTDSASQARRKAIRIARRNRVAGERLLLRDSDIEVGSSSPQPDGKWGFTPGGSPLNAVRVNAPRNAASRGGTVSLFFGSLIGRSDFDPVQSATASFMMFDICLVLDRSTSMKNDVSDSDSGMYVTDPRFCLPPGPESRWNALDVAVRVFIDEVSGGEGSNKIALASYSSALALDPDFRSLCGISSAASSLDCVLRSNLATVQTKLTNLTGSVWNGNTNIESGLRTGVSAVTDASRARDYATKVIILMTDGNENVGSVASAASDAASQNITVHTVTFGADANQPLMANVAATCNGSHYHANTPEQLREVFRTLAAVTTGLVQ